MRSKLIAIGNSRGLRLPKAVIEACGLSEEVELTVQPGRLVVSSARRPREGWEEAFRRMAQRGDDKLLDPVDAHSLTEEEADEWQW